MERKVVEYAHAAYSYKAYFPLTYHSHDLHLPKDTWVLPAPKPNVGDTINSIGVSGFASWLTSMLTTQVEMSVRPSESLPSVSIIITHYNRGRVLLQCLQAIANQSYDASKIEVIVVDDGSTKSDVLEILKQEIEPFIQSHGWTYMAIANSYLGAARNAGAARASGSLLLFLDDDDVPPFHFLKRLVSVRLHTHADIISTFFANFESPDAPGTLSPEGFSIWPFFGASMAAGMFDNAVGGANIFTTREAFDAVGGFSELSGAGFEDFEYLTHGILLGFQHTVIPEPLLYVRRSVRSMMATMDQWMSHMRPLVHYMSAASHGSAALDMSDAMLLSKSLYLSSVSQPVWFADSATQFSGTQGGHHFSYGVVPAYHDGHAIQPCVMGVVTGGDDCVCGSCVLSSPLQQQDTIYDGQRKEWHHPSGVLIGGGYMRPGSVETQSSESAGVTQDGGKAAVLAWSSNVAGNIVVSLEYTLRRDASARGVCVSLFSHQLLFEHCTQDDGVGMEGTVGDMSNVYTNVQVGTRLYVVVRPKRNGGENEKLANTNVPLDTLVRMRIKLD
jgi:hypothetical protein